MHHERHRAERIGWLRAAVLGANDGIVSTASLILGVAATDAGSRAVTIAGVAGLVAGAMSMAAGEYVSVSSQSDTEDADLAREKRELETDADAELAELTGIYVKRGVDPALARQVSEQMTAHDALAAHARDELGIVASQRARPVLASLSSAASFSVGAALPLVVALLAPWHGLSWWIVGASLLSLALLGAVAAGLGGAKPLVAATRVTFWGALAMLATHVVGAMFGTAVG